MSETTTDPRDRYFNYFRWRLRRHGIERLEDVQSYTEQEFRELSLIGGKTVRDVRELLRSYGMTFARKQ